MHAGLRRALLLPLQAELEGQQRRHWLALRQRQVSAALARLTTGAVLRIDSLLGAKRGCGMHRVEIVS